MTLREWRRESRWPLKRIAAELGVTMGTWSRWEHGVRVPSIKHIRRLSDYLHIRVCSFLYADKARCPACQEQQP